MTYQYARNRPFSWPLNVRLAAKIKICSVNWFRIDSMHCISYPLKWKEGKPLLFEQTLRSRFMSLACQHFSFHTKKLLDRERPFPLVFAGRLSVFVLSTWSKFWFLSIFRQQRQQLKLLVVAKRRKSTKFCFKKIIWKNYLKDIKTKWALQSFSAIHPPSVNSLCNVFLFFSCFSVGWKIRFGLFCIIIAKPANRIA